MNNPITTILCKKYFREGKVPRPSNIFGEYKEGVYYNRFLLETEELSKKNPVPYTYKYVYIYNENGIGGHRFHLNKNKRENIIFPCFYDYFYDNQELRKLKLKKIQDEI